MMRVTKLSIRNAAFAATLLLGFVASGCAQESSEKNLQASSQELPQAVAPVPSAAVPLAEKDCPSAQRYRDNICELAKKICGLQEDPGGNASAGGSTG
ncbi:MAG TPA: hypothetical protein VHO25_14325, partial [Polyangiaceae bacterium]|nr:hypothetical protein [Polyangiaceae bacterium]